MSVEVAGEDPIVLDLGTGLRLFGQSTPKDVPFRGTALLTHLHWDHVQGLPFFVPILAPGAELDVYGPAQESGTLAEAFDTFLCPPYFPVTLTQLPGDVRFHDVSDGELTIGRATVRVRQVPHLGPTNGYRIDWDGASVAYISDHQSPGADGAEDARVADSVLDLCRDVDLLVHDAQYTTEEWAVKSNWGHCSVDYALRVAEESGARRLVLFHHDPAHGDDQMDELLVRARACGSDLEEVIAAAEGMTISLDR